MKSLISIFSLKGAHREWSLIIIIACKIFHLKHLIHMKFMTKTIISISKIKLLHFKGRSKINFKKMMKFILIGTIKINWEIKCKAISATHYKIKLFKNKSNLKM